MARDLRMQGSGRSFVRDILLGFIPVSINKLTSLIYLPLIFKYAGVAAYAIWQQFGLSAQVLMHLGTMNVGVGIKKYLAQKADLAEISKIFYSALAWVVIFSILCSAVLLWGKEHFGNLIFTGSNGGLLIVLLIVYIPLEALLSEIANVIRAIRAMKVLAILGPLRVLIKLATVTVALIFLDATIVHAIAYFIAGEFAMLIVFLITLWTRLGLRTFVVDLKEAWKYVSYGFPFVVAGISTWISAFSDRFFLLHYFGLEQVGIYAGAYVISSIPLLFANPICQILLPDLSKLLGLGQNQKAVMRAEGVMLVYGLIAGCLSIVIVTAGPTAIEWLGRTSVGSIKLMLLLATALGAYGLLTLQSNVLTAFLGRSHFNLIWVAIAICNILLNLLLIPRFNVIGAAIASLGTYCLGSMAMAMALHPKMKSWYLLWVYALLGLGITLGTCGSHFLVEHLTLVRLALVTILAMIAYTGTAFILFRRQILTITQSR
ncbi:MAG: oligosaccharide flippase family protein [Bacteroidota bacterium]